MVIQDMMEESSCIPTTDGNHRAILKAAVEDTMTGSRTHEGQSGDQGSGRTFGSLELCALLF
jgi:hypothetical protein